MRPQIPSAFAAALFAQIAFAQPPNIIWHHCYGGSAADFGGRMADLTGGGLLLTGTTYSNDGDVSGGHGDADGWTLAVDSNGVLQWQRALGGTAIDQLEFGIGSDSGDVVVAGTTYSNDGDVSGNHSTDADIWVAELDTAGSLDWQYPLGGTASDDMFASYGLQSCSSGGFLVCGSVSSNDGDVTEALGSSDLWLARLGESGNLLWQRSLGGSSGETASMARETADGGFFVVGTTTSNDSDVAGNHGSHDGWVARLDASGTLLWQRACGGSDFDFLYDGWQTSDSGFIVAGTTYSNDGDVSGQHGDGDLWLLRLDASGGLVWQAVLGGSGTEGAGWVFPLPDGSFLVAGQTTSNDGDVSGNHGGYDAWVLMVDDSADVVWNKVIGGSGYDAALSILPTDDGGFLVSGNSDSNDSDLPGNHGSSDIWLMKLLPAGVSTPEIMGPVNFTITPNPTSGSLLLTTTEDLQGAEVIILNVLGEELLRERATGGIQVLELNGFPKGAYTITLRTAAGTSSERVILE